MIPSNTYSAGGLVLNADNKILLTNRFGHTWTLPKGIIDKGETELQTAKREIYEETGLNPNKLEYIKKLGSYSRYKIGKNPKTEDKNHLKNITLFLFQTDAKRELKPPDETHTKIKWADPPEAVELLTHHKDKQFLKNVLDKLGLL